MPPSGGWRPAHNIRSVLTSIRLLMASPNPDDPLMADIVRLLFIWMSPSLSELTLMIFTMVLTHLGLVILMYFMSILHVISPNYISIAHV